jgi:glyoxylase-like metal-dependent hydrolase (beta-lactamase superfamily II)
MINMQVSWLHKLSIPMPAFFGVVNSYLIKGRDGVGLIDVPLFDSVCLDTLNRLLSEHGITLKDVDTLVCTHGHPDHCGLAGTLKVAGAEVFISEEDAGGLNSFLSNPELDYQRASFFENHKLPDGYFDGIRHIFNQFRSLQDNFNPVASVLKDKKLNIGGVLFDVIPVPGHTPGHICLFEPESGILFTGDHILEDEITHITTQDMVKPVNLLGNYLKSVRRVCDLKPSLGYGGHGPVITDIKKRGDELITYHLQHLEMVEKSLKERGPCNCFDLSRRVFGKKRRPLSDWLSVSRTYGYLEHLVVLQRIKKYAGDDGFIVYSL